MNFPAFITVRSTSSRLPSKCFLPFGRGCVLEHVIRRAKTYDLDPIVCTTFEVTDDRIAGIANAESVKCFRGEPIHKLKRWADCCAEFDIEAFHTVDADDPFFDGEEMKQSYSLLLDGEWDMVAPSLSSAAGGASVGYSLRRDIIERAVALTSDNEDTEMMWYWVDKVKGLKKTILPEGDSDPLQVRLTLDYEEDYWLLASILRMVGPDADRRQVNDLLRQNPDLFKINWFRNEEWALGQESKRI